MYSELIHIYGPFSIHSFGLFIIVGLGIFTWLTLKHPMRKKIISSERFIEVIGIGTLISIITARVLYIAMDWHAFSTWTEMIALWEGGFSLLGAAIGIVLLLPFYLKKIKVPILPFFDLLALHAPLLQAIARLGCFAAGCCYGSISSLPWAIQYHDPASSAPLCIPLHPAQIYSSLILLIIFLCMYCFLQRMLVIPGRITCIYLMFMSGERFIIDFFRGDREYLSILPFFSVHQYLALGILFCSSVLLLCIQINHTHKV